MFRNGIEAINQDKSRQDRGDLVAACPSSAALRVALTFDMRSSLAWIARVAEVVNSSCRASVGLLIVCDRFVSWRKPEQDPLLFRAWRYVDGLLFRVQKKDDPALGGASALSEIPQLLLGEQDFTKNGLSVEAYEQLQGAGIDLIIDVGHDECWRELRSSAQYGAWRIPDPASESMDRDLFWRMYQNVSVSETTLEALPRSSQATKTMDRCFAAIDLLSLARNRRTKERKSCELLRHNLQIFRPATVPGPGTTIENEGSQGVRKPAKPIPSSSDVATFLCKWIFHAVRHALRSRIWREHWFIAYRQNLGSLPSSQFDMQNFQIVESARHRFYADPFCIDRGGKSYLFFEDYPFDKGQGLISFIEIDNSGKCSTPEVALKRDYHLSYPHVFEHAGEIYMVPESLECRRVELYRATDFPRHWILEKTLIDNIAAVDPTILFHNGKVWLFVSGVRSKECINEELFLFFADSLVGQWTPHPCNPIVSDVRKARPAGRICFHDGKIIRPAQDCSQSYGKAITFHQIDALTDTTYHETPIATIGPEWHAKNLGTHTFNQSGLIQTVDGRVWMRKYRSRPLWRAAWNQPPLQEYAPSIARCEVAISPHDSSRSTQKADEVLIDPGQEKRYAAELIR